MLARVPIGGEFEIGGEVPAVAGSVEERIAFAFRLWDEDCRLYSEVNSVSVEEAALRLAASRQTGRVPLDAPVPPAPGSSTRT